RDPRPAQQARGRSAAILATRARSRQAEQRARQRRERAGRKLRRAVAVAEAKADDAGAVVAPSQIVRQGEYAFEKPGRQTHVGVEQEEPVAAAESGPFVDSAGKTAIASPAAQRDAGPAPQLPRQLVARRMIIDDYDLDGAAAHRG